MVEFSQQQQQQQHSLNIHFRSLTLAPLSPQPHSRTTTGTIPRRSSSIHIFTYSRQSSEEMPHITAIYYEMWYVRTGTTAQCDAAAATGFRGTNDETELERASSVRFVISAVFGKRNWENFWLWYERTMLPYIWVEWMAEGCEMLSYTSLYVWFCIQASSS